MGGQRPVLAPGPEPVAPARRDATGAPATLFRFGAGDPLGDEPRHARAGVETGPPRPARIHHHANVGDRERGFGDGGSKNELASLWQGHEGCALGFERKAAMKLLEHDPGGQARRKAGRRQADLPLPWQKHQNAALGLGKCRKYQIRRVGGQRVRFSVSRPARPVTPAGLDGKGSAFGGENRRIAEKGRDRARFEGGGHHQDTEVRAQRSAALEHQREAQIGLQRALVEFIEYHAAYTGQIRVTLQHPRQDALGDDLDPAPRNGGAAHPVADRATRLLAEETGDALRRGPGGDAARLEHEDSPGNRA